MHRLVAYAHDGVRRFPVDRDELVLGSGESCHVRLPFSGVGETHARLHRAGDRLEIEDLGRSRRGVLVNGRRVQNAELRVLDEIRIGSITLLLEDEVAGGDGPAAGEEGDATVGLPLPEVRITPVRMLDHLADVSRWVMAESRSVTPLEVRIDALLDEFGGGVLYLFQGERGIKFVAATDGSWLSGGGALLDQIPAAEDPPPEGGGELEGELAGAPAWICWRRLRALERSYLLVVALPQFRPEAWSPLAAFGTLADQLVLGLIHHVGRFEPLVLARPPSSDLRLPEGFVAGQSPRLRALLDRLRVAVNAPNPVLLVGEDGTGRELLARALHLSGGRSGGPLVVCACGGDRPETVEIDLFGAVLEGREGPLLRRGKVDQARGGTLVLLDVDELSLEAQGRLVRVLRTGEVEPAGRPDASEPPRAFDARIVAIASTHLDEAVARGRFRADLAHRLESLALEVPPLRQRREDLPLLIQTAVNRACHETGKRVHGITVDAMEALTGYDYPGNLPELDAIVRRLVYLMPTERPVDATLLPDRVRRRDEDLGSRSDLDLARLVDSCERRAVREALRRTDGNKSAAARLLGVSRNGLALKLRRWETPT